MLGCKPVSIAECVVTNCESRVVVDPYAVVVPYSTCELAARFVLQPIVAAVSVTPLDPTFEIVNDGGLDNVVKLKSELAVSLPELGFECTRRW